MKNARRRVLPLQGSNQDSQADTDLIATSRERADTQHAYYWKAREAFVIRPAGGQDSFLTCEPRYPLLLTILSLKREKSAKRVKHTVLRSKYCDSSKTPDKTIRSGNEPRGYLLYVFSIVVHRSNSSFNQLQLSQPFSQSRSGTLQRSTGGKALCGFSIRRDYEERTKTALLRGFASSLLVCSTSQKIDRLSVDIGFYGFRSAESLAG